jgi:nucleotide-binding universal stress UspA family protein
MERVLVYVDDGTNGRLAARLSGMFTANRQMLTTVLGHPNNSARGPEEPVSIDHHAEAAQAALDKDSADKRAGHLVHAKAMASPGDLEREMAKGYSIIFTGVDRPVAEDGHRFDGHVQRLVAGFDGPVAIAVNGAGAAGPVDIPLDILVPTSGRPDARLATEIALVLAKASGGTVTALHVFDPREDTDMLRGRGRRFGMSVLVDAHRLGKLSGVPVKGLTAINLKPEVAIRRALHGGKFDLIILGTSLRRGESKFLGPRSAALLRVVRTPTLLIAR